MRVDTTPTAPEDSGPDFLPEDEDNEEEDEAAESTDNADDEEESESAPSTDDAEEEDKEEPSDADNPTEPSEEEELARYEALLKDPKKLAKAFLDSQRMIGKQANEIGELRKQVTGKEPVAIATATPLDADDDEPIPYDPATADYDEATGYPLSPTGEPFRPLDAQGVPYTPEEVWENRLKILEARHGSAAVALRKLEAEQKAERKEQIAEYTRLYNDAQAQQQEAIKPVLDKRTQAFAKTYRLTEPEARGLVKYYKELAEEFVKDGLKKGEINLTQAMRKDFLNHAFRTVVMDAEDTDSIDKDLAEVRKSLGTPAAIATTKTDKQKPPAGTRGTATPLNRLSGDEDDEKFNSKDFTFLE